MFSGVTCRNTEGVPRTCVICPNLYNPLTITLRIIDPFHTLISTNLLSPLSSFIWSSQFDFVLNLIKHKKHQ